LLLQGCSYAGAVFDRLLVDIRRVRAANPKTSS
jgi:hypothetical protein